ncbi:MAG TPA: efflux RND transporter periplasmic adaptor subunit [Pirellulales bacterium]|nr:efflux RND transporter periplasmic adaptor subunit [Pirellulales bacterium]
MTSRNHEQEAVAAREPRAALASLAPGCKDTLELPAEMVRSLGIRVVQATSSARSEELRLSGSLFLDPNRLVRVHSRFAGEVVSIGETPDETSVANRARPLRLGDHVAKGQLLAVIWSKDVGEKKSDLVNSLSQLFLDRAQLKNLSSLGGDLIGGQKLREAERQVEADIIQVERLERTLRSWRLTEREIEVVRQEAEKIHRVSDKTRGAHVAADIAIDKSWAEVEVRSPFDGVILEKNIVAGDIVDTSLDLFKIADLSVLGVMANAYEEDLAALESLRPQDRHWSIALRAEPDAPPVHGEFELIGHIVDPNQHTAAIMGWLDNSAGRLRAGQFITALVELPTAEQDVAVPESAIVQEGDQTILFVAANESSRLVTRRNVAFAGRGPDVVYIRSKPSSDEQAAGCQGLQAGEWVVASGAVELDGALSDALATNEPSPALMR